MAKIKQRLSEPSTWAGIAILAQLTANIVGKPAFGEPVSTAITAIGSALSVILSEKGQ